MILCWYQVLHSGFQIFFTPSRIKNARGNVTLPLESPTNVGDLNRQRCKEGETLMLITCAGMGSKCLIGDIHKIYPNGIYLDYGSGLDFICTKRDSRGWNYSYDALYNAFLPLLPEDWNDPKYDEIYNIARVHMGTHLPK